ncbi:trehalose-phosphatase [bacterium]|nr:trehalose-phosphatase [bacterium]
MTLQTDLTFPDTTFFNHLEQASQKLLLLDFDGTLSPFVDDRFKAFPYPGVTDLLYEIIAKPTSRVVIVTGRPLNEILPLLNMQPNPEIWGSHGWQHLLTDGTTEDFPLPDDIRNILETVKNDFQRQIPIEKMDIKPSSVAVHWRGLDNKQRETFSKHAQAVCEPFQNHAGLELQAFDGGLELRVKGRDKGTSVKAILKDSPNDIFATFLGDDKTDEDAFAALGNAGQGILVRNEFRPTDADFWIHPPEELLDFLRKWRDAC